MSLREQVARRLEEKGQLNEYRLSEVQRHSSRESAWIIVDGYVYDITHHVQNHSGWNCGCAVSELLAILNALGTDCTKDFMHVHSDMAKKKLQPYMIGRVGVEGSAYQKSEKKLKPPDMPITMAKCCIGALYYSQQRYDREKPPVCAGFGKRLHPNDESVRSPTDAIPGGDFKYMCVGYSAYDIEALKRSARERRSQADAVQLPYCEGLEIVSAAAMSRKPELLTGGPPLGGPPETPAGPPHSDKDPRIKERPGRTFVPGAPDLPSNMEWDQFKERFDRISRRMLDKMKANAMYMGSSLKKSWEQIMKEVKDGGRDR